MKKTLKLINILLIKNKKILFFMKTKYTILIYTIFVMTFLVIFIELINVLKFKIILSKNEIGMENYPTVNKMAEDNKSEYLESQKKGTQNRLSTVILDISKTIFLIFVSLLFLNLNFRKYFLKIAENNVTFINNNFRDLNVKEINFLCLFVGLYLLNKIVLHILTKDDITKYFVLKISILGILIYLVLIPILIYLSYVLLEYFGKKIIIACYLAYIIKILPDVFINDEVNSEKMEQVDITTFPDDIQNLLHKYNLEDAVYKEIEPGNEKNAALIGYGDGARMEIYGDFDVSDKDELFSVFLHEIGHAKENTLLRKTVIYIILLLVELFIILFIYDFLSPKFVTNIFSIFTCFIALFCIYRMIIRQWLILFYKVVSQQSEINSDLFAKAHSYGNELSHALFNIVIESSDYLRPTVMYNFLRSGHPPISRRIEYLHN